MKKKVLAKSTRAPNKLIKELMKREGKKSQVKIGDMREVVKAFAVIMSKPMHNNPLLIDLCDYVCATHKKLYGVKVDCEFVLTYKSLSERTKATDKYFIQRAKEKAAVKKSKALGEK